MVFVHRYTYGGFNGSQFGLLVVFSIGLEETVWPFDSYRLRPRRAHRCSALLLTFKVLLFEHAFYIIAELIILLFFI